MTQILESRTALEGKSRVGNLKTRTFIDSNFGPFGDDRVNYFILLRRSKKGYFVSQTHNHGQNGVAGFALRKE